MGAAAGACPVSDYLPPDGMTLEAAHSSLLARLDAAFIGGARMRPGDLRATAKMHARSLALLARDMRDPAAAEQAALLEALLAAASP